MTRLTLICTSRLQRQRRPTPRSTTHTWTTQILGFATRLQT